MTFTPTEEQQTIVQAAKSSKDNLLINALAGAAKTTTLELIAKALPGKPILSIAFNKRIAEELKKRLPGHTECATINSIGHRTWGNAVGKRLTLNTKKTYEGLKAVGDELTKREKEEFFEDFSEILKVIDQAKSRGYVPDNGYPHAKRLCSWEEFELRFETPLPSHWKPIIDKQLFRSIKLSYEGIIDFNDQIYMPTLFGGSFPQFPLTMIDEAQDLSSINHEMLRKLVGQRRLIAVGDPLQSIYAFRGSVSSGMDTLKHNYNMEEFRLSISFRCPKSVVMLARERAPFMQWPEWAEEGTVTYTPTEVETRGWSPEDGAAVICRNNAPLFALAFRLIRAGRGIKLYGSDIGPGLIKILKGLGALDLTAPEVHTAIDSWKGKMQAKSRAPASLEDRAECLHIFADQGPNLGAAIAFAEHLFTSDGPIQLMSGHKSKGLEFDTVYHLDPWRIPSPWTEGPEELEQELNLRYVITTRAKKVLHHVNLEDFTP